MVEAGGDRPWVWLSPQKKLHAFHPTRNSVVACGKDWDGWKYHPRFNETRVPHCKNCKRIIARKEGRYKP